MRVANPIGKKGEDEAVKYLQKKGYKILERNFQGRQGEIDIIAVEPGLGSKQISSLPSSTSLRYPNGCSGEKEQTLVFIEVKTRRSYQYGTPAESIRHAKIANILITAGYYVATHKNLPEAQRVDAIAVTMDGNEEVTEIEQIENISGF